MDDYIDWQLARLREDADRPAIIWTDRPFTAGDLVARCQWWNERFAAEGIAPGDAVAVVGDYSPASVSCLLALARRRAILVPLSRDSRFDRDNLHRIAEIDHVVEIDGEDHVEVRPASYRQHHPLLEALRAEGEAGLVVFTSGSTGDPKAIVHALAPLLGKFRRPGQPHRAIGFLLFDHLGGLNTLFYTLANKGCLIVPIDRRVASVCAAIEKHQADLLPVSASFLTLLVLAQTETPRDLSSLRLVTYGTEPMPERTLSLANRLFPHAVFKQTYGLSEVGVLRTKSASTSSLLVKLGGEDYETKVIGGTLRIRARCAMRGYLNAPSPFDEEGWLDTGDAVVEEDGYYRIVGRHSDLINVGGQKVHPAAVEKVILEMPGVIDVSVSGQPHPLMGQIVTATVQMDEPLSNSEMKQRIARFARERLPPFMIPVKVRVVTMPLVNERFKKVRR